MRHRPLKPVEIADKRRGGALAEGRWVISDEFTTNIVSGRRRFPDDLDQPRHLARARHKADHIISDALEAVTILSRARVAQRAIYTK
ncbi:hypothetical protein FLW53_38060 [Microbispora sp. SCL1-1]|uniref:hypothetical protein n=2 Tax=unclassified Microbispora TaxID=2614687 RepID=UPI0011581199|nr:hypothetical protein [Microbispora sp. SCL1-1]NJP29896.1 hypothetical protein [Microbispora sp. CL1-1]TQS03799.1 hypothetical protein FLW53_38060 [Microbispora sp. SCL1-1]